MGGDMLQELERFLLFLPGTLGGHTKRFKISSPLITGRGLLRTVNVGGAGTDLREVPRTNCQFHPA
jgi:hypothetical protein